MTLKGMKHLNDILDVKHRRAGMRLVERDDHTLELKQNGSTVARFSATGVTQDAIRHAADLQLEVIPPEM
jgi:hypothetical protein